MKVFIINGAPGSGKTTFEQFAQEYLGKNNCFILSTIDYVKDVARYLGWDGQKDLASRRFLSDLKDALSRWNNVPRDKIIEQVQCISLNHPNAIFFIDCREPNEISELCEYLNAKAVLIKRNSVEEIQASNHADAEILNYPYAYVIDNNGSLDDLFDSMITFIEEIKNPDN